MECTMYVLMLTEIHYQIAVKKVDIIKKLIQIYGNKEIFVNEYRSILADILLSKKDYETENESRILELLKIRFGEKNLQNCEIMIKDINDSKRIHGNILEKLDFKDIEKDNLQVTIISKIFWPNLQKEEEEEAKLHPTIYKYIKYLFF